MSFPGPTPTTSPGTSTRRVACLWCSDRAWHHGAGVRARCLRRHGVPVARVLVVIPGARHPSVHAHKRRHARVQVRVPAGRSPRWGRRSGSSSSPSCSTFYAQEYGYTRSQGERRDRRSLASDPTAPAVCSIGAGGEFPGRKQRAEREKSSVPVASSATERERDDLFRCEEVMGTAQRAGASLAPKKTNMFNLAQSLSRSSGAWLTDRFCLTMPWL